MTEGGWDKYSGAIKIIAFVEQDTGQKLQIRISKIQFDGDSKGSGRHYSGPLDTTNYEGGTLTVNAISWDEKVRWSYCD